MSSYLRRALVSGLASVGLTCASCSSQSDASVPAGVYGSYYSVESTSPGEIQEIDFTSSTTYESLVASGIDEPDSDEGTYVLDTAAETLTLRSSSGSVQILPFMPGVEGSTTVTIASSPLHLLGGGTSTLGGTQPNLGTPGQPLDLRPYCSFSLAGLFQSTSPNCQTAPPSSSNTSNSTSSSTPNNSSTPAQSSDGGGVSLSKSSQCLTSSGGCCAAGFPNGLQIEAVANASLTATYAQHISVSLKHNVGITLPSPPTCFIDMQNLVDANTHAKLSPSVMVSAHYSLQQAAWGHNGSGDRYVVIDSGALGALEAFHTAAEGMTKSSLAIYSGFRSTTSQEQTCESVCPAHGGTPVVSGQYQWGCTGSYACATASQHMWGDAFDLTNPELTKTNAAYCSYARMACQAGFKYVYNESNHLHADTWDRGISTGCMMKTLQANATPCCAPNQVNLGTGTTKCL